MTTNFLKRQTETQEVFNSLYESGNKEFKELMDVFKMMSDCTWGCSKRKELDKIKHFSVTLGERKNKKSNRLYPYMKTRFDYCRCAIRGYVNNNSLFIDFYETRFSEDGTCIVDLDSKLFLNMNRIKACNETEPILIEKGETETEDYYRIEFTYNKSSKLRYWITLIVRK